MANIQKQSTRNNFIELERFIACLGVLLFHADIMPLGWIFVEFFFILTGLFTMQHMQNLKGLNEQQERWYPLIYTWKRVKRLLPYTTISILLIWVYDIFAWNLKGVAILKWLLYLPAQLLLLNGFVIQPYGYELQPGVVVPDLINPQLWYIYCMIPALIILVFLLQHSKKSRVLVLTVLPLVLIGTLILIDGTIAGWHRDSLYLYGLDMRALAEMLIGADVWYVKEWLSKKEFKTGTKVLLTAVELFCFFSVFLYAFFSERSYEILFILMFAVSVSLSASGKTYTGRLNFRFFGFLGKLSLPIYCFQLVVAVILGSYFSGLGGNLLLGAVLFLFSMAVYFAVEGIRKKMAAKKKTAGA